MKMKINAASVDLEQYKDILEKFNFEGDEEEGIIEINTLEDVFDLQKEINKKGLIFNKDSSITIYDDWLD